MTYRDLALQIKDNTHLHRIFQLNDTDQIAETDTLIKVRTNHLPIPALDPNMTDPHALRKDPHGLKKESWIQIQNERWT